MKKVFLIVTLLVLGFGLVACGGNSKDITPEKKPSTPSIINENVLEENVIGEEVLEEDVIEEEVLEENVLEKQEIPTELIVDQSFFVNNVVRNIQHGPKAQSALNIGFWHTGSLTFNLNVKKDSEEVKVGSILVFVENLDTNQYIVQEITHGEVLETTEFEVPENDFDRFIWGIVILNEDGQLLTWGFDRVIKKNVL